MELYALVRCLHPIQRKARQPSNIASIRFSATARQSSSRTLASFYSPFIQQRRQSSRRDFRGKVRDFPVLAPGGVSHRDYEGKLILMRVVCLRTRSSKSSSALREKASNLTQ